MMPFLNKLAIPCYSLNSFYQAHLTFIQKRLNDLFPYLDRLKNIKFIQKVSIILRLKFVIKT